MWCYFMLLQLSEFLEDAELPVFLLQPNDALGNCLEEFISVEDFFVKIKEDNTTCL